jgi:hypothetical protein
MRNVGIIGKFFEYLNVFCKATYPVLFAAIIRKASQFVTRALIKRRIQYRYWNWNVEVEFGNGDVSES